MDLWILLNIVIWYMAIANFKRPKSANIMMPLLLLVAVANIFISIGNFFTIILVVPSFIMLKFYTEQEG